MKQRATVICRRGGQILLVARKSARWALPGGKVKAGKALVAAAERELLEETALVAESLVFLFNSGEIAHCIMFSRRKSLMMSPLDHAMK